jgi:hypothetical protein
MDPRSNMIARTLAGLALSGAILAGQQAQARTVESCRAQCGNCTYWYDNCTLCGEEGCGWGAGCSYANCVCAGLGEICYVS